MLEINTNEDIIVPFEKIGDKDWEVKTTHILEALADNWNNELKEPISLEDIEALETRLGTTLPASLKVFYQAVGLADIGEELQELKNIGWIKDYWSNHPENSPNFTAEDSKHLPFLVSFSDCLGNGNMCCFHSETKEIYYYDHDGAPYLTNLFDTIDDYIKCCLVLAQVDLFGEDAEQDDVERWTEELVIEMMGEEVIQKWRY
jgi:hypothetical protein